MPAKKPPPCPDERHHYAEEWCRSKLKVVIARACRLWPNVKLYYGAEDMEAEGAVAAVLAARDFDPERRVTFNTFASVAVMNRLRQMATAMLLQKRDSRKEAKRFENEDGLAEAIDRRHWTAAQSDLRLDLDMLLGTLPSRWRDV